MTLVSEDRIRCPIKGGIWRVLAEETASDRRAVLRELISNSIDAINKRLRDLEIEDPVAARTFVKKIEIIYMKNGDLWCIDNGTGIRDIKKFMEIGRDSYKEGVVDPEYDELGDDRIGAYHVGKLSFVIISLKEKVYFESVNKQEIGLITNLAPNAADEPSYAPPEYCKADRIMSHTGLMVKIKDLEPRFIMPVKKAKEYLSELFAPWIAFEDFKISIRNEGEPEELLTSPPKFHLKREPLFKLSDGSEVWGVLNKSKEPGRLWGYKTGVLIKRDMDFGKKMENSYAMIRTRGIKTNIARDSFITNEKHSPLYPEFIDEMIRILDERNFEDSEKPKKPPRDYGKAIEDATLQSLQAIVNLDPYITPPAFLSDFTAKLKLRQPEDESEKKIKKMIDKLTSKRRKLGLKTKKRKPGEKTGRINEKHKHKEPQQKLFPEGTQEGENPPKIKTKPGKFGKNADLVFFDKDDHAMCVNKDRENYSMFTAPTLQRGAKNEVTRAVLKAIEEYARRPVKEFDTLYYNAIDERERNN